MASAQPCAGGVDKENNKTKSRPIKQTNNRIKKKKRKRIRTSDPERIKQLAATEYLTNPCNFKGMNNTLSISMLYK